MERQCVVLGASGILLGLLVGWIIGAQQAAPTSSSFVRPASDAAPMVQSPHPFDEKLSMALQRTAAADSGDAESRIKLGNLYFEATRFDEAIRWYLEALSLDPSNSNVSTDIALCYYYSNRHDEALAQLDQSLSIDPRHLKTLFTQGIVRARGKGDLAGATKSWRKVIEIAPQSEEATWAKRALEEISADSRGTRR